MHFCQKSDLKLLKIMIYYAIRISVINNIQQIMLMALNSFSYPGHLQNQLYYHPFHYNRCCLNMNSITIKITTLTTFSNFPYALRVPLLDETKQSLRKALWPLSPPSTIRNSTWLPNYAVECNKTDVFQLHNRISNFFRPISKKEFIKYESNWSYISFRSIASIV